MSENTEDLTKAYTTLCNEHATARDPAEKRILEARMKIAREALKEIEPAPAKPQKPLRSRSTAFIKKKPRKSSKKIHFLQGGSASGK